MNKILKKLVLDMNFRKWPNWQKLISLVLVTVMTAAIIVIPKIEKTMAAPVNPLPWSLQNGGFESGSGAFTNIVYYTNPSIPGKSPSYAQVPQDAVNYWSSSDPGTPPTVPPQAIEIWGNGFNACGSFYTHDQDPTAPTGATSSDIPNNTNTNNNHFAEISATINTSAIYQDIRVVPGEHLNWSLWHRGRFNSGPYHNIAGWDVMQVLIGPSPAGFTVTDGKYDAWKSMSTTQPQKDKFGGGLSFAGIEEDENNDKQQNFTAIVPDGSGFGTDNSLYYIADWTNAGYSSVPPGLVTNTVSNWEYHEGLDSYEVPSEADFPMNYDSNGDGTPDAWAIRLSFVSVSTAIGRSPNGANASGNLVDDIKLTGQPLTLTQTVSPTSSATSPLDRFTYQLIDLNTNQPVDLTAAAILFTGPNEDDSAQSYAPGTAEGGGIIDATNGKFYLTKDEKIIFDGLLFGDSYQFIQIDKDKPNVYTKPDWPTVYGDTTGPLVMGTDLIANNGVNPQTVYIRQIVLNSIPALKQPAIGIFTLEDKFGKLMWLTGNSATDDITPAQYKKYLLKPTVNGEYSITDILPQYYEYAGYQVSSDDGNYDNSGMKTDFANGEIPVSFGDSYTLWVTVYIQPSTDDISNYYWSNAENDIGIINPNGQELIKK